MTHPGLELHILSRAVYRSVSNHQRFGCLVLSIVTLAIPDPVEAVVGEPAVITARDNQPLHLTGHLFLVEDSLSVCIGEFGELLGDDIKAPLRQDALQSLFLFKVFIAVAKELEVCLGYGFAATGIGNKVIGFLVKWLAHNCRVGNPDNDVGCIAVLHPGT